MISLPLSSSTNSFNRYLLYSYPMIIVNSEYFYNTKFKKFLPIVYFIGFGLSLVIFTQGFWVG